MAKIKSFSQTALLASASQSFHNSCSKTIGKHASVKTILGTLFTQYNDNIKAQESAASKDLHLSNTDNVTERDKTRDGYFKVFVSAVDNLVRTPDAQKKADAKIVASAISRYRGLDKYEMNKETGEIENMVAALRVKEVFDAMLRLNMESMFEDLLDANYAFISAVEDRHTGELKKDKNVASVQRKITETTYLEIVERINAFAIAVPSADLDKCIDQLNAIIDDYARTIAHMRSGGAGNEKLPKGATAPSL